MLIRLLICGYMATARLIELAYSRRNIASRGPAQEGGLSRRTFPLVVATHAAVIGGTLLLGSKRARLPWLALLFAVQPLRFWVLAKLGRRWNARGAVFSEMQVETGGPYAYVRHPNYAVVAVELFTLPAAFGLAKLAFAATAADAFLLAVRIRDEEELLSKLPGYSEHFAGKARLIPGLL